MTKVFVEQPLASPGSANNIPDSLVNKVYSAVWVKVDGVHFSEMRGLLKVETLPTFLCHLGKWIL